MTDPDSAPITAAQAAQLAQKAQQDHARVNRDAIKPALTHAYAEIRQAAGGRSGLNSVEVKLHTFGINPDQLLAFQRVLQHAGFSARCHPSDHSTFVVGWQPVAATRRSSPDPQFGVHVGTQQLLRE
ncbi:hypothetical protein [Deinococcus multiflagellatus]|uniref:Uncharacterized protein n=1 Tax=Deinococcus multiflagellatus TaxID=1656887 RepID=A0ABW1ZRK3_9DEIO|nr:hypothetical protein [Deinococcus multiflagellatus]MBZ9715500.1 hypothetical protein [Deinococcus multiflagellatus]